MTYHGLISIGLRTSRPGLRLLFSQFNPLKADGHYIYRQFDIQQLYVLPTQLYLCVLCGSQNKQPLFPYTALTDWFV
jgi:hypothetical protein